jgi:thioredoxin 1
MSTKEIDKANFENTVETNDIVVLDAWASWCGPCKAFAPIYEAASERHPDVIWGKLDTEHQPEIASAFQIRAIPTIMVFRQGILIFQQAGVLPANALDDIVAKVKELDMDDVKRQIEEHQQAHARGECNHDHGHDHGHDHEH